MTKKELYTALSRCESINNVYFDMNLKEEYFDIKLVK